VVTPALGFAGSAADQRFRGVITTEQSAFTVKSNTCQYSLVPSPGAGEKICVFRPNRSSTRAGDPVIPGVNELLKLCAK